MSSAADKLMTFLTSLAKLGVARRRLIVLIYHRVLESGDAFRTGDATAEEFDAQIGMLSRTFPCYTFGRSVQEYLREPGNEGPAVAVTFDDGYRDNHDLALPILQKHGVPATFFVASGYLNNGIMWNDLLIESIRSAIGERIRIPEADVEETYLSDENDAVCLANNLIGTVKHWDRSRRQDFVESLARRLSYEANVRLMMNHAEVRSMSDAGMEIGAHTVSHPILSNLATDESMQEIIQSKSDLEHIIGKEVKSFAYPNGRPGHDFSAKDVDNVVAAGFSAAATTAPGYASPDADSFLVPRLSIWGDSPLKLPLHMVRNLYSAPDPNLDLEGMPLRTG
mgnify:CR=1 FL=1